MLRAPTILAILALLTSCQTPGDSTAFAPARPVTDFPGFKGERIFHDGSLYFGGQPGENALREAARRGIRTVVNLRAEAEMQALDFDEPALVESLGLEYVHLPITPRSFNRDDIDRFAEILANERPPLLVHCGSSNRVGGLWAAYLIQKRNISAPEALRLGEAAGLARPAMRDAVLRVAGP